MWPAPPQRIANHSHLCLPAGMRMVLICVRVRNDNANNSHLQARLGCCVKTTVGCPIYGGLGSDVRKKSFKINDLQQGYTPAAPVQKLKCKISYVVCASARSSGNSWVCHGLGSDQWKSCLARNSPMPYNLYIKTQKGKQMDIEQIKEWAVLMYREIDQDLDAQSVQDHLDQQEKILSCETEDFGV